MSNNIFLIFRVPGTLVFQGKQLLWLALLLAASSNHVLLVPHRHVPSRARFGGGRPEIELVNT
jgi:hypothetical protein